MKVKVTHCLHYHPLIPCDGAGDGDAVIIYRFIVHHMQSYRAIQLLWRGTFLYKVLFTMLLMTTRARSQNHHQLCNAIFLSTIRYLFWHLSSTYITITYISDFRFTISSHSSVLLSAIRSSSNNNCKLSLVMTSMAFISNTVNCHWNLMCLQQ